MHYLKSLDDNWLFKNLWIQTPTYYWCLFYLSTMLQFLHTIYYQLEMLSRAQKYIQSNSKQDSREEKKEVHHPVMFQKELKEPSWFLFWNVFKNNSPLFSSVILLKVFSYHTSFHPFCGFGGSVWKLVSQFCFKMKKWVELKHATFIVSCCSPFHFTWDWEDIIIILWLDSLNCTVDCFLDFCFAVKTCRVKITSCKNDILHEIVKNCSTKLSFLQALG